MLFIWLGQKVDEGLKGAFKVKGTKSPKDFVLCND